MTMPFEEFYIIVVFVILEGQEVSSDPKNFTGSNIEIIKITKNGMAIHMTVFFSSLASNDRHKF